MEKLLMNIRQLLYNIRFYILLTNIVFSVAVYVYVAAAFGEGIQVARLTQIYALTSITYLYLALFAGPFCYTFQFLPFRGHYLKARRALGVSAFYFGFLHFYFAFFGELGGFAGLGYLSNKYLLAISFGFTTLIILFLMVAASFDFMVSKLTFPRWNILHRFVYLAGVFTLIHALMLGTQFRKLSDLIPQIVFIAVFFLLFLEGLRFDALIQKKLPHLPSYGVSMVLFSAFFGAMLFFYFVPNNAFPQLGIHAAHIQLAKDIQFGTQSSFPDNASKIPGLDGDRTKRYSVNFIRPEDVQPNQDTELTFQVSDASSGNRVQFFKLVYGKVVHLIIVDTELKYFDHIHPEQTADGFVITYKFPKAGVYHLYTDFQPLGGIEQFFGQTLHVGNIEKPVFSEKSEDTDLTKTFGKYEVTLQYPKPLQSAQISIGKQRLLFTIKDVATRQGIKTLKPYLQSLGHLVMINQQTFEYLHVHPANLTPPKPDENGGHDVEFIPLGIYSTIKPGMYRVFAQFNPDNNLFTSDFTIKIE